MSRSPLPTVDSRRIFASEVQYFRLDPRNWAPVLDRLVECGLRCVSTYIPWGSHLVEPPRGSDDHGRFDFEGQTDGRLNLVRFMEMVTERGLDLNFRAGPFCCAELPYGGYPQYLCEADPAMMVWDHRNTPAQGYWIAKPAGMQPSYLHPAYLQRVEGWFAQVAPLMREHLKSNGGCITMVSLDNEVSYIVRDSFLGADYNPVNVAPGKYYHQYLAELYGSPDELPYPQRYRAFEDVAPPREVPAQIGDDLAWYRDWGRFKTWAMCEYLRRLRQMHEANGIRDVIYTTNFNPHRPEGLPTRMPDFERAVGGIVGYDFYRGTFMSYSGYHSMARVLKLMNASLSYTWSAEFMAGTWTNILSSRVSDDHMRFMARCALAHGCKSISWFMFHDRDVWGDAPVSQHGHARPSLAVLRETVDLLFDTLEDWDALEPVGDVAVIYDRAGHEHTHLGDPSPCADNDLHMGGPSIDGVAAGMHSREYEGLFRLIEQAGMQAKVVDVEEADASALADVPLACLPGGAVVSEAAEAALRKFIEGGGTLVVTGVWPCRDDAGRARPLLGIEAPTPCTPQAVGRGRVAFIDQWIAQAEPEEESAELAAPLHRYLHEAVPQPAVRIEVAEAPVRYIAWGKSGGSTEVVQPRNLGSAVLHRHGDTQVLFVLNHYPVPVRFQLTFADGNTQTLTDLDTGATLNVEAGSVILDIDRKSGAIYRVN